jgi:putative ABC transport system substrate-binding protein
MRRREFITLVGGAASWPLAARAQQPERMRRVGIVMPYAKGDPEYAARVRALRQELAKLGWTEGTNVQFDERWTTDDVDRVHANAASLMASNPDVVVAAGGRVIPILMQLSRTIPIVLPATDDPLGTGWVESLARPGGNVTGFTSLELSMFGKILETLKQIAPTTTRVGLIYNPDNPTSVVFRRTTETFAGRLVVEPVDLPIHGFADLERAVASLADRPNSGVFFLPDVTVNALRRRPSPSSSGAVCLQFIRRLSS